MSRRWRREPQAFRRALARATLRAGITIALVSTCFAVAIHLTLDRHVPGGDRGSVLSTAPTALQHYLTVRQIERLEIATEVYRAHSGEVPDSLETLVREGRLEARDLTYPGFRTPYYYRVVGASAVIYPPKY